MLKGKAPLIIAVTLGATAAGLTYLQQRAWRAEATEGWKLEKIIVAATDLEVGSVLTSDSIETAEIPRRFAYDSFIKPSDLEVALNQTVVSRIPRGEPVQFFQLQGARTRGGIAHAVPKGGRAVTIDVNERSALGMLLRPNDHVDVLGTFRDPRNSQTVAVTLLQNVIVLATGKATSAMRVRQGEANYSTITLRVMPGEAEILVLAQEMGSLYLTLRSRDDISHYEETARTTIDTVLTGERLKKLRDRRYRTIQIIRGLKAKRDFKLK
ncbi:MAG: Flp pilus assembly protein CpaB [Deltaproteobacteria bacterium]|nr:Flp pilus assembly protein CpaB [Deltaproteobacteria bacterium]